MIAYKPLPEEEVICPNCRGKIVRHQISYVCESCLTPFYYKDGINCFLPKEIEKEKTKEDELILSQNGSEARVWLRAREEPWYLIMVNYFNIRRFEDKILSRFDFKGKVLDLAAGVCWASSLIKNRYESSKVYALDVSPAALTIGKKLSGVINAPLDYLVAADAERLPFRDGLFDSIVCNAALHHLHDLPKALWEIRRILKDSGTFVTFDSASSDFLHPFLLRTFCSKSLRRTNEYNVKENLLTFSEWRTSFKQAGFVDIAIELERDSLYRETLGEKMLFRTLSFIPSLIINRFLASSIILTAKKYYHEINRVTKT